MITVVGKSARNFYLKPQQISDFKSLMRTITSGRIMIVSTWFRSDLFYFAEKAENESILKGWALHANANLVHHDEKDMNTHSGNEPSLSEYFQSINSLALNWYKYRLYKKAFHYSFSNDPQNPVAKTVAQCDRYLTEHPQIKRTPLTSSVDKSSSGLAKDTFALAMRIINNQTHSN